MKPTTHPELLLLPGMDGTGDLFDPFVRTLPGGVPSSILQYPTDEILDYEALTRRVAGQLPTAQPFVLVAESFSGPIAIELAARGPAGLVGLVLVATFATRPTSLLALPLPRWIRRSAVSFPMPVWMLRRTLTGGARSPAAAAARATRSVSPDVLLARADAMAAVDKRAIAGRIDIPTLYLCATGDRLVSTRHRDEVTSLIPNAEALDLDAPHLLLQCAPTEAAGAIMSFIETLRTSPDA